MDQIDNTTVVKLKEKFPDAIQEVTEFRNEITVLVKRENVLDILRFMHDDKDLGYNFLADITSVDWFQRTPRFDVVYHLRSLNHNFFIRIKTHVKDGEKIESATPVWTTANWLEREVYDLMGIEFSHHPDLRRILTPDHWEDYPLRKDYPLVGKNEPIMIPTQEDVEDNEL